MKSYTFATGLLILFFLCRCEHPESVKPIGLDGMWTIEQVLSNDFWGGPYYWKNIEPEKQVKFTSSKYYKKTSIDFELIGSYRVLSEGKIEITWDQPPNPEYPTFQWDYEFDSEGRLTPLHESNWPNSC